MFVIESARGCTRVRNRTHKNTRVARRRAFVQGYLVFWDKALVAKKATFYAAFSFKKPAVLQGNNRKKAGGQN